MSSKSPMRVRIALMGLVTLLFGTLLIVDLRDRPHEPPRLVVTGSRHETGQGSVSFRILVPESQGTAARRPSSPGVLKADGQTHPGFLKAVGFVFSQPRIEDASGRIQNVSLIRYVTPANEPSLGIVQDNVGIYRLRLDVSFEETGPAGWLRRIRNCWTVKSLQPLRENVYRDPVSITSDWITNANRVARSNPP